MVTVILTHEVKNFEEWQAGFNGDSANRKAAGFNITGTYRAADNENMITVTMEAPSAEAVHTFMSNPALQEAMTTVGVISAPEVKILNSAN